MYGLCLILSTGTKLERRENMQEKQYENEQWKRHNGKFNIKINPSNIAK